MAGGFLAVVNLFSGSVRSVNLSSQYLKAVTLANSKMNELEIENFVADDKSGIQLQNILLKVFWNDNGKPRKLELATLRLDGKTYPMADTKLKQLFRGGAVNIRTEGQEETTTPESTLSSTSNISGSITSRVSGSTTQHLSGN